MNNELNNQITQFRRKISPLHNNLPHKNLTVEISNIKIYQSSTKSSQVSFTSTETIQRPKPPKQCEEQKSI